MKWTANDIPDQTGRRVVITGGNSGIGFHAALELARRGAEVILPTRNEAKGTDAFRRIRAEVPAAKLVPAILDLSSQASVHAFAGFVAERFPGPSLDLLINNAGIMALPKREVTEDGFERQFATNCLGPFVLTRLLMPSLIPRAGTRIVSIASVAALRGRIDFDNLQSERAYSPFRGTYAMTKLADLIFALELQRRLSAAGSPILSLAAHPGVSATNLPSNLAGFYRLLAPLFMPVIAQSPARGALPMLFAATASDVTPGGYYGPDGWAEYRGFPRHARLPDLARDQDLAKRLWAEEERLTGVRFGDA